MELLERDKFIEVTKQNDTHIFIYFEYKHHFAGSAAASKYRQNGYRICERNTVKEGKCFIQMKRGAS